MTRLRSLNKLKSEISRAERCGSARMTFAYGQISRKGQFPMLRMTRPPECPEIYVSFWLHCGHSLTVSVDRLRRE
jgi:hypothetical protein